MTTTEPKPSGLDLQWVDPAPAPRTTCSRTSTAGGCARTRSPTTGPRTARSACCATAPRSDVRAIVEECAAGERRPAPTRSRSPTCTRRSWTPSAIEAPGTAPLRPLLDEVDAAADRAALAAVLGRRQREGRAVAVRRRSSRTDAKDSTRYLVHLDQSGLGLPDESYYREDAYAEIRTAYVAHLERLAELVGLADPARARRAR